MRRAAFGARRVMAMHWRGRFKRLLPHKRSSYGARHQTSKSMVSASVVG